MISNIGKMFTFTIDSTPLMADESVGERS